MQIIRSIACFLFNALLIFFMSACGGGGGDAPPPPPTATTGTATGISRHAATLNGTVNPHAQATNAWFEWGTDNALAFPTSTTAQAIGAGSAENSVSASIMGLTLGTTYFYRVAATNASGTQKAAIASFTTALPNSPPSVTTDPATSVTISGAVLNGTVSPNELATSAMFEWGTDSNLANFASTSSQSLGAGTTSVGITGSLTGLTPGVTYYFRVAATNTAGTSKGLIANFTAVAQAPTVSTAAATSIMITGATLNGTVNPNGLVVSDYHFEFSIDSNMTTFSTTSVQTLAAAITGQSIIASLTGLTPGVTYYFRTVATNSAGTSKGTIVSFDTATQPPTVATADADNISIASATLHGTVNPNGLAVSDSHFEYGTSPTLETFSTTSVQTVAAGLTAQPITASPSGLASGTTYYFRVVATNSEGTSKGLILSFNTATPPPTVVTAAATSITSGGGTLHGTVNPNGLATNAYFEYGTDPALATSSVTSTQAMGSGGSAVPIAATVSLSAGATYYFRVAATNAGGTSKGTILSFSTPISPTVATNVPTSLTTASAIFNGSVNPNGLSTTAWFEYGTDPSLSSWTNTTIQAIGSGTSPLSYSRSTSGLSSHTTYYYRAAASNSGGTQKGTIKGFLTGETYVAVGDSITIGSHDDISADGIGYEPILGNLLGVMIAKEGVSGDTSADGVVAIDGTLSTFPDANYYLILYGTNDASIPVPKATYKANMQTIIDKIKAAVKTPLLAKVPYASAPGFSDASIQEYNAAIDELKVANGITVIPPDFYAWFKTHPDQLADELHPNGTGYQSMANLWFNALP